MKKEIRTERPHLFAPGTGVSIKAVIEGNPTNEQVSSAIRAAVLGNEVLACKIVLDKDGRAYYEKSDKDTPKISIEFSDEDWISIIKRNAKYAYDIFNGELCRFFVLRQREGLELLIIGHHLAGDGLSFVYLLEDIMNALEGVAPQYKSFKTIAVDDFPADSKMPWVKKSYLKHLNQKWISTKKVFDNSDYMKLMQDYSATFSNEIFCDNLSKDELDAVVLQSKKAGVSVNSLLTTIIIKAFRKKANSGLSISLRDKAYKGMANLVSGTGIIYQYDTMIDFDQNATTIHKQIHDIIHNGRRKYFVLRFLDMMDGCFLDSACMVKYQGFQHKRSEKLAKLMYYGANAKDIGISNLTRTDIKSIYGDYVLKEIAFVPPTVPYGDRIFGIITHSDTMGITMNTIIKGNYFEEKELFEQVIYMIKNLDILNNDGTLS